MNMNMKHFRKVASDKESTTFQHKDGHQMKVLHKALSPKMRGDIAAMPIHKDEKPKDSVKMADGGPIIDQEAAAAIEAGAMGKKAPPKAEPKKQENYSSTPLKHPSPPNTKDEAYKSEVQKFNAQMNQPGMANGGEVKKYAEGTPDAPVQSSQPSDKDTPEQIAQDAGKQPIVINVGTPPPAQPDPNRPAQAYEDRMKFYQQNTPGAPAQSMENDALAEGERIKNIDAYRATQAEQTANAAHNQALATNERRAALGLPPVSVPPPGGAGPAPASVSPGGAPVGNLGTAPQPDNADSYGMQAYQDTYLKGLQEQKSGLMGQASATAAQGAQEAASLQKAQEVKAQLAQHFQDSYNELDKERKAVLQDYKDQHIDPNHFWANRSTVGKIGTVIGMILGGVGGGENSGVAMLNKQIDRDIDSQKANLGKTESILNANMKQFGNLRDATDMTRLMQIDIAKDQLAQAAAQAKGPLEKARALQAIGQLDQQAAPIQQQIAMRKTLMKGANSGAIDPERAVELMLPEHAKPEARKELKDARDTIAFKDNLLSAFDQLTKLQTVGQRAGHPWTSVEKINALKGPLTASLSKNTAGKFTEQDAHMLDSLWPSLKDDAGSLAVKRNQLLKLIQEKMHFPVLKGNFGLDQSVINSGRYDSKGQSKGVNFTPGTAK